MPASLRSCHQPDGVGVEHMPSMHHAFSSKAAQDITMASDPQLHVGDSFDDFSSLKSAVELFEQSQKSNYWIRDCRTIEAAQKKGIKRPMRESLIYYNLTWACVKGGRNYDESIRSPRGDCGSYVKVAVSKDGQALVIKDICTRHNHDTSQETFELLPKQKRLSTDNGFKPIKVKKEKKEKVAKNRVKKLIQRNLMKKSGKVAKIRKFNSNCNNPKKFLTRPRSLQDFVDGLRQSGDVTVEVIEDEKGNMKGLFWQDSIMKTRFDSFPELLIVGSSNELNRLKTSVVFQITVDGNGESQVASVFFISSSDDVNVFTSLLNIFRNHNAAWLRTRTVLASKDHKYRHVYTACFPDASLHICMSQVMEEMKKDILADKMCMSLIEKMGVLSLLEKMAHAQSPDSYDCTYDELQRTGLSQVMNYFNQKWHPLRHEWVSGLKTSVHFNNETTQRLDIVYDRVKDMVRKSSPLPHFCQDLQKVLQMLQKETDDRITGEIARKSGLVYEKDTAEHQFANFLTPYAFSETLFQLRSSASMKMDAEICDVTSPISITTSADNVLVSATSCSCQYFSTSWLPCQHIFAFRCKAGLDLYFEDIAQRWQLSTLKSIFPVQPKSHVQAAIPLSDKLLKGPSLMNQPDTTNSHFYRKPQTTWPSYVHAHMNGQSSDMSQTQKFESLLVYAQRLAQLGSDVPMGKFIRRRETLSRLVESWERGDDVHDDSIASSSFQLQPSHLHQEDLSIHNLSQPVTNQIQPFQVHGPSSLPDNHHMGSFVAKERPYHIPYHQQDHSSHGMGMMEHIPPWSHIVL